ncbi:mitochondrial carrier [Basidiobolus meristosporus CBS 931.73]|uniref:Mitochondrial carrier n=1 Tax=Basidiobolus meristosporus CBS 931.73 TaxID=1314790 RepID=A0A1Y1Z3V8_9FUNG|nr:mitochondrial carrier [Basidiobolus meristosporus CBS 931.73]|eukprot:ORY04939.1 mitochondrial carrier [Basidiobolus meristosporus CBS 931.73]
MLKSDTARSDYRSLAKVGVSACLATCAAVTFSNPWEVVKTRLQLQGELTSKKNPTSLRPYNNSFSALVVIFRTEGIRGLQKGLGPAYCYQIAMNGTRFTLYEPFKELFNNTLSTGDAMSTAVIAGAASGVCAAAVSSPLYLVKTRMQSYSPANAIGYQHYYKNTYSGLSQIFRQEGIRGLFRGVDAAMIRTSVGSAAQLSTYDKCKQAILRSPGSEDGFYTHCLASMITSIFVCLVMNPFDVVSTRMYNQKGNETTGKGSLYRNPVHCLVRTVYTEGISGLYKGVVAHYLRIG